MQSGHREIHHLFPLHRQINLIWKRYQTSMFGSFLTAAFLAHGLPMPQKSVLSFSHHLRHELLATGRFLTIVAGSVLEANAERWNLKALPIDLTIQPHSVAAFTLKQRTVSPVVELFIKHAREVA